MKQNKFMIIAAVLMLASFALAAFLYQSSQTKQKTEVASAHAGALMRDGAPRKGNPQAKVTIVEFFDPACETCRDFEPIVEEIMAHHPDRVNLVLRYAPLHHGSDQMVKILEAANTEGKFWDVLHLMFDTQQAWAINHQAHPDIFWKSLEQYGFDVAKLRAKADSPEVNKVIAQDVADGQVLGANMTPTFFVNGKPLPQFGRDELVALVNAEVKEKY